MMWLMLILLKILEYGYIRRCCDPELMMVGNKCDLEDRTVSYEKAKDLADELDITYLDKLYNR